MKKPSPSLVVAVIALVVAATGVATALPGRAKVDKNDLKPNVVKSKHVAPNTLQGSDVAENTLGEVPSAGGPFAYARVTDGPATTVGIDEARSKGVTDAMVVEANSVDGKTCFDLPFTPKGAQVTIDYAQANGEFNERSVQFAVGDPYANCSTPHTDAVVTVLGDVGSQVDLGFYIAFYR